MKRFTGVAVVMLLFIGACSQKDKVVTKIGGDKITVGMVEERLKETPPAYQSYLDTAAGRKQFVDLMVRERIVLENARKEGYKKNKDYAKAIGEFKKDQARRLRDYEENLLMEMYVKDLHSKLLNASDQDIQQYYKDHQEEFSRPVEIKVRHILVPTKEDAEKAFKRVKSGEDFAKVAKEMSTDPMSAPRGGEIGPFRRGELVPEFENVVFPLKLNEVSGVVETQFGFHVVKKIEEKVLATRSLDDSKAEIKRVVEKKKFDEWLDSAKQKLQVNVDYNVLSAIPPISTPVTEQEVPQAQQNAPAQGTENR